MSIVLETTLGDLTIDLYLKERPRACLNFLKLCKMKYYNYNLFHTVSRGFIAQTGDPTGSRDGGESVYGAIDGALKRYFEGEKNPRIKHTHLGLLSFVGNDEGMIGSQFFITLGTELTYLDEKHCVFGEVVEGLDVIELINETICDGDNRPYKDVRITHTVVLDDPLPDVKGLRVPSRSPSPSAERLKGGRIGADEDIDDTEGKSVQEISEMLAEREAKARATILEMVGDLPDAEMAPPENVLFVCKLNPVTTDDDLEIIFSRFGKIKSCEVIRDRKTEDSLQYAFVEFEDKKSCEDAYFKMDNVLIDDRRIHVDFSQSVSKIKWHGKGRGVTTFDDKGRKVKDTRNDIGQGRYKSNNRQHNEHIKVEKIERDERKNSKSPNGRNYRGGGNKQDYGRFERRRSRSSSRSTNRAEYSRNRDSRQYRNSPPNRAHPRNSSPRRERNRSPPSRRTTDRGSLQRKERDRNSPPRRQYERTPQQRRDHFNPRIESSARENRDQFNYVRTDSRSRIEDRSKSNVTRKKDAGCGNSSDSDIEEKRKKKDSDSSSCSEDVRSGRKKGKKSAKEKRKKREGSSSSDEGKSKKSKQKKKKKKRKHSSSSDS